MAHVAQPTPTDATDKDANPPQRPMPAFLSKLVAANQNVICTAKGSDVRKASIAELFAHRLRIPIFQRRYCWGQEQWDTLFADALTVADGHKEKHSLGRITCVKSGAEDGRLLVIDGQQRNTTCSLLLAAIRDTALRYHEGNSQCQALAARIDSVLLPGEDALEQWIRLSHAADGGQRSSITIPDGESLEFAGLVPTYCDRASYFAAVLPPRASVATASGEWKRPMAAKNHYLQSLKDFSGEQLGRLADVVLYKLEWLYFPLDVSGNHQDGTEDLQVIFERLAVRDATYCKPHRDSEYQSMGAADFVRNLLLGSFRNEADAINVYKSHWLPIEQAAAAAAEKMPNCNLSDFMEEMMKAFLKEQPEKLDRDAVGMVVVGGQMYPRFRKWLRAALATESSLMPGENAETAMERKTTSICRRLQGFATLYFAEDPARRASSMSLPATGSPIENRKPALLGTLGSRRPGSGRWRCPRCSFSNEASFVQCTACSHAKPDNLAKPPTPFSMRSTCSEDETSNDFREEDSSETRSSRIVAL